MKKPLQWAALIIGALGLALFGVLFGHIAAIAWPLTAAQFLVYLGLPALETAAIAAIFLRTRGTDNALAYTSTAIWMVIVVNVTLGFLRVFGF